MPDMVDATEKLGSLLPDVLLLGLDRVTMAKAQESIPSSDCEGSHDTLDLNTLLKQQFCLYILSS